MTYRKLLEGLAPAVLTGILMLGCQELPTEPAPIDLSKEEPVAADDEVMTPEETLVRIQVLDNDSSLVDDELTLAEIVTPPVYGEAMIDGEAIEYTPNVDYNGSDSLRYRVSGSVLSSTARVQITVTPVNDPPVAVDDTFNVAESIAIPKAQSAVLDVLLNDSDVDGDVLRIIRTSSPANGSVEIATDALTLTYEPTADFTGSDQFTYTISDGNAGQDIATVTISVQPVNDPPTVADGTFATNEDEVRTVQAPGVLRNASDPEDDPLTAVLVTDVSHGVLQLSGDGGFVYDPDTDFNGQDQFTFAATDGLSQSAPATAVINVIGINDAPVATADSYATSEDETLTVSAPGILENDVDVDGDALTITVVNGVMHGELNVSQDGGFTYTPDEAYSGDDGFQYQIDDGTLASQATVTISVGPVNDPPTASPDQFDVASNVDLEVPPPGVLENDADEEGDMLSALLVDSPQGELDLGSDGGFLYSPPEGYSGTDSFSYRASDGVNLSEETTVVILVSAVGNPPVGVADEYSVPVNDTLEVSTPGVLENDSDEDGDSLSAVLVDDVSEGTLALTREGGFTYEPPIDFAGIVTFRYRASDGANVSKITLVTITVQ